MAKNANVLGITHAYLHYCFLKGKGRTNLKWGSWAFLDLRRDDWGETSSMYTNIWREGIKGMEPGSALCCKQWDERWWTQTDKLEVPEHEEGIVYSASDQALEQAAQRGCSLPHWRYSQSCALCSRMTLLEQGGWTSWHTVVLSSLTLLWFSDCHALLAKHLYFLMYWLGRE